MTLPTETPRVKSKRRWPKLTIDLSQPRHRVYLVLAIAMTTAVVFLTMFRIVIGRRSRKTPPAPERIDTTRASG